MWNPGARDKTLDAVARGLRLRRHDAELAANERVEQRRLADVGRPASTAVPQRCASPAFTAQI
jgi:hypothetical protein